MDEELVRKSYRSIVLLWVLAILLSCAAGNLWVAVNITVGVFLMTAVLMMYDVFVHKVFTPGAKPKRRYIALMFLKLPVLGIIIYFLTKWSRFQPLTFCGGIVLVHLAIYAKLAGIRLVQRAREKETGRAR